MSKLYVALLVSLAWAVPGTAQPVTSLSEMWRRTTIPAGMIS